MELSKLWLKETNGSLHNNVQLWILDLLRYIKILLVFNLKNYFNTFRCKMGSSAQKHKNKMKRMLDISGNFKIWSFPKPLSKCEISKELVRNCPAYQGRKCQHKKFNLFALLDQMCVISKKSQMWSIYKINHGDI